MLTLTWIDGVPIIFDDTEFLGFVRIELTLFGKKVYNSIAIREFDRLEFVEIRNNNLTRILYGI